jgi:hypothetical protein
LWYGSAAYSCCQYHLHGIDEETNRLCHEAISCLFLGAEEQNRTPFEEDAPAAFASERYPHAVKQQLASMIRGVAKNP